MDGGVGCCCIAAGMLPDDLAGISVQGVGNEVEGDVLSGAPGCSGANSVKSQTLPSMTIQQSSGVLCLLISSTESCVSSAIARDSEGER